jgi:hypothetical protein
VLIEFYGSGDDNMCFRINGGRENGGTSDEVGCYQSGKDLHHCTMLVSTIGGTAGVKIHAIYDGCWSFAVGMTDEGRKLPDWVFRVDREHKCSTRLVIVTGDELVTVTQVEAT